jgi:hypothetical protein
MLFQHQRLTGVRPLDAAVAGIPHEEDDARAHTRTRTHAHADARTRTRRRTKTHTHALMSDRSNIVFASPRRKRPRVAGRSTLTYRNSEIRIQCSRCRDGWSLNPKRRGGERAPAVGGCSLTRQCLRTGWSLRGWLVAQPWRIESPGNERRRVAARSTLMLDKSMCGLKCGRQMDG